MNILQKSAISPLSDDDILHFWKSHLWKDRTDPVRTMSSMLLNGEFNMEIYTIYKPHHVGLFLEGKLIGCNSCHKTSSGEMRSRGLFVLEEYRGQGLSQKILQATEKQAAVEECGLLWSYPRLSSLEVYQKFGFVLHPTPPTSSTHRFVWKSVSAPA